MDFPPVSNLVNATFDQLNYREVKNGADKPPIAPQPVSTGNDVDSDGGGVGMNSSAESGTNRVGTVLDTVA